METNWLKSIVFALGDYIDAKINTKSGRLTLLILGSVSVGAAVSVAYSSNSNLVKSEKEKLFYQAKTDTLQKNINTLINNQEERCNEKQLQSARLQEQLKNIYNGKVEDNNYFIEQQKAVNKETEKVIKLQEDKIKQLEKLTNE